MAPEGFFYILRRWVTLPCALLFVLLTVVPAVSALPRPHLKKLRTEANSLVLSVSLGKRLKRRYQLAFQASLNGEDFVTIRNFSSRARKKKIRVPVDEAGVYSFRARLKLGKKGRRTAWSNNLLVVVSPSAAADPDQPGDNPAVPELGWPALSAGLSECDQALEERIFDLINAVRSQNGLAALGYNYELTVAARNHSIWMAQAGELSHAGWFDRIVATGLWGNHFAQNIARYISDPVFLVDAWMGSPSHAKNIISDKDSVTGISCVQDVAGTHYWSQNFGG